MIYGSVSPLWELFSRATSVFAVKYDNNVFVNEVTEERKSANIRFFITEAQAGYYRKYLIEACDMAPSKVKVVEIPISDLTEMFNGFRLGTKNPYNMPVKVTLSEMNADLSLTTNSEEIFNSTKFYN